MKLEKKLEQHIQLLMERYHKLLGIRESIVEGYQIIENCYKNGGKLLIAGNGGSDSDANHIVGELMKKFMIDRPPDEELIRRMNEIDPFRGRILSEQLEQGLPAIALSNHSSLNTAFINDVDGLAIYAQQILGYGNKGDVLLGISTSGNSKNIMNATVVARAKGLKIVGLTGDDGGELAQVSDVAVKVPENKTYMIQELHLPIYHCWCIMLEDYFFGDKCD